MNRLTLLLAWLAPMITVELLARRGHNLKLNRLRGGWWAVRVAPHRFSYAPNLRTALVAALRKVKQEPQKPLGAWIDPSQGWDSPRVGDPPEKIAAWNRVQRKVKPAQQENPPHD